MTVADGGDIMAVFAAPGVMRFWNSTPPAGPAEAVEWAARLAEMQRRQGYAQWHVSEKASRRVVGFAGLQRLDGGPEVELTYAFEPSSWGKGFATEAAAAALTFGFLDAGLPEIVGIARAANGASLPVMEKIGMRRAGPARYFGSDWIKYTIGEAEWVAACGRDSHTGSPRADRL